MRTVSFHKDEKTAFCLFCKRNKVAQKLWNRPCDTCKGNRKKKIAKAEVTIGKRQPAAVITGEGGRKIFVDKFGVPVEDHGYDLDNDPRGWKTTGTLPEKLDII